MRIPLTRITATCLATIACVTFASTTWADFTPVLGAPGAERDHLEIFADFYSPGTAWQTTGDRTDGSGSWIDMTNGILTATRVDDFGYSGTLDARRPYFGEYDDESWTGTLLNFTAAARYAGYTQEFGYSLDGDDRGYNKLFKVRGNKSNVHGSATLELEPGASVSFMRDGNKGGQWSSSVSENSDGLDHMVTYSVTGFDDDLARWMLFWEDLPGGGDRDYNDLAVEVTTRVPEPGTGLTIVLVCGVLAIMRRRML